MAEKHRPIYRIASDIAKDWGSKTSPYARPYLAAMLQMNTIHDKYILDSGRSVVLYFLSNAGTYRGENARKFKEELKTWLKEPKENDDE